MKPCLIAHAFAFCLPSITIFCFSLISVVFFGSAAAAASPTLNPSTKPSANPSFIALCSRYCLSHRHFFSNRNGFFRSQWGGGGRYKTEGVKFYTPKLVWCLRKPFFSFSVFRFPYFVSLVFISFCGKRKHEKKALPPFYGKHEFHGKRQFLWLYASSEHVV